jgi:predicted nucleic acid-binding protein
LAIYFFDTSALVKRYISEPGSAWVRTLYAPDAKNECVIAEISAVELVAAIFRRVNRGDVSLTEADNAMTEFQAALQIDQVLLETSLPRIQTAMEFARKHRLRGYDAVQLAMAKFLSDQCRSLGLADPVIITSDLELAAAAAAEGLTVDDPNTHP